MKITLITQRELDVLLGIQSKYPALTYQNKDFDYLDMSKLSDQEKKAFHVAERIIKKSILGFRKFNNFKIMTHSKTKNVHIGIRFQYNWSADTPGSLPFTGVGYMTVRELFDGFNDEEKF